jgi:DNA-binding MarR family transcriptional regulator
MGLDKMYLYMQYYSMTRTEAHKPMNQGNATIDQIACECLLGRVRKLDRVLTGIYDAEFRPFGLKATQINLLVLVAKAGPIRRIDIAKGLHLDPSTLTRNLKIMLTNGWIKEIADGEDGRGLPVQVTAQGRDLLNQIGPSWRKAQTRTQKLIGDEGAALLRKLAANRMEVPSG